MTKLFPLYYDLAKPCDAVIVTSTGADRGTCDTSNQCDGCSEEEGEAVDEEQAVYEKQAVSEDWDLEEPVVHLFCQLVVSTHAVS